MLVLAFESSAKAASVAIAEEGRLLAQSVQNSGLTHSRTLLPMAQDLLKNTETALEDIGLIAVAHGPGSFTGIRIGVSAAKGLAWALDKRACGVSTLEAMAWHCSNEPDGTLVCPVMDARRSQVYNSVFEIKDGAPFRLSEDRAVSMDELAREMDACGRIPVLVGDGAEIFIGRLESLSVKARLCARPIIHQSAWGVAMAAMNAPDTDADGLLPVYLRLSQAERERQKAMEGGR